MSLNPSNSKIKEVSFELLNILDELVQPELKQAWLKRIWNWFAMNRGKQIIMNKPDQELKEKMHKSFKLMETIFHKVEIAEHIQETDKLNSGKGHEFVKKINAEAMELIPDA
jgi:hypothetical protein